MFSKLKARVLSSRDDGFTLVELIVTAMILGILSSIAVTFFLNQQKEAINSSVKADVRHTVENIATAGTKIPSASFVEGSFLGDTYYNNGGSHWDDFGGWLSHSGYVSSPDAVPFEFSSSHPSTSFAVVKTNTDGSNGWSTYVLFAHNSSTGYGVVFDASTGTMKDVDAENFYCINVDFAVC